MLTTIDQGILRQKSELFCLMIESASVNGNLEEILEYGDQIFEGKDYAMKSAPIMTQMSAIMLLVDSAITLQR